MSANDVEQVFWVVWNPSKGLPQRKHSTEREAIAEAERLAKDNPTHGFYVLKAMCVRRVGTMQRIPCVPVEVQLPF